jgi:hypothetical protein
MTPHPKTPSLTTTFLGKVDNLNHKTLLPPPSPVGVGVRVAIILVTLLLILSACVDPTPTPGTNDPPGYDATATYGAEEYCKQLKSLGTPCP